MKLIKYNLVLVLIGLSSCHLLAQTTVWIVRHAEKDTSDLKNPDPELSVTGLKRADDLAKYLGDKKLSVIYTSKYKRAVQTAKPLSEQYKIPIKQYENSGIKKLAEEVMAGPTPLNVLIVGHTNTVLETIEAFGTQRPVPVLTDDDYDYIFKLTLDKGRPVKTDVLRFGAKHRNPAGSKMIKM